MTQDVSNQTNTSTISPRPPSIPIQPWSLTTKADELMEEVFAELDSILEYGGKLPTQTAQLSANQSNTSSGESTVITQVPKQTDNQDSPLDSQLAVVDSQKIEDKDSKVSELTSYQSPEILTNPFDRIDDDQGSYIDKVLFILTLGCLVAVIWWLVEQDKLQLAFLKSFTGPQPTDTGEIIVSESDAQFIEYMQRSLDVMELRIAQRQEQQQVATAPLPVPPNPASASNPLPATILQPIYIPFSPQGQILPAPTPSAPAPAPSAPTPSAPAAAPSAAAPSAPAPAPAPATPPQAITPTPPSVASIKKAPSLAAPPPAILPPPIPQVDHILTGLLEDGDHSAALFDVNGTTQRIRLGEPIGASGWILVEIVDQKAIIRRNGKVRAIYAGQKF